MGEQTTSGGGARDYECSDCWRMFLSSSAALVPTPGVRNTACVGAHKRAVSDYSGKFPHTLNDHFDIKHLKKLPHQSIMFFIYIFQDALLIIFKSGIPIVFSIINKK
jgi:hypothetical protein